MSYFSRRQLRVPSSMTELASRDKTREIRSLWSLSGNAAPHSEGTRHHPAGTFPLSVKHKHSRGGGGVIKFPTDYQKPAFCCLLPGLSHPAAAPIPSHPASLPRLIYPCRSLCETVKRSCAPVMACYGYPWPEILNCDKFPADHELCISAVSTDESSSSRRSKGFSRSFSPHGHEPVPCLCWL